MIPVPVGVYGKYASGLNLILEKSTLGVVMRLMCSPL